MPVPKFNLPKIKKSEERKKWEKVDIIIRVLTGMGYDVIDVKDAVDIIERNHLDKSKFDYPYGSFETFKQHVLAGEYEYDRKSAYVSKEIHEARIQAVKEGKLWVTY